MDIYLDILFELLVFDFNNLVIAGGVVPNFGCKQK